jgi:hypothetical protein
MAMKFESGEDAAHAAHVPGNHGRIAECRAGAGGHVSTAATPARFTRELREICGAGYVIEDPARLEQTQILGVTPAVAVNRLPWRKLRLSYFSQM